MLAKVFADGCEIGRSVNEVSIHSEFEVGVDELVPDEFCDVLFVGAAFGDGGEFCFGFQA